MIEKKYLKVVVSLMISCYCFLSPSETPACDRECLKEFITIYMNALLAREPDLLPVSENVRFTEDCKEMKIGEGFWKEAAGSIQYRFDILDERMNGAFAFTVLKNGSTLTLYGVRLKISADKITQIETMVVKNSSDGMIYTPNGFKTPDDSIMRKMPQESQLNSREEMIEMAVKYPESFKVQGSTFQKGGVPFVKSAYRLENGQLMAGPGCTFFSGCSDIRTQALPHLPYMLYEVALVDEQAGIVLLRMNFGAGSIMQDPAATLDVFEAFKIYGDSVRAVIAFMQIVPDVANRTTEALFNWNYKEDVTKIKKDFSGTKVPGTINALLSNKMITVPVNPEAKLLSIKLYDISGKMVRSVNVSGDQTGKSFIIPIDNLSSGRYWGTVNYSVRGATKISPFNVVLIQ